jgi:7,8-dihydro-6-hydroxymethylpterin-pyrophosphokinase
VERVATPVAVALGSNLGDRRGHLEWAAERLSTLLADVRLSAIHETTPQGVPGPQPP